MAVQEDTRNSMVAYHTATTALGIPSEFEGDLDTGWEYYHLLNTTCDKARRYLCELYARAKTDTYIAEVLAQNVGQPYDELEINGVSGVPLDELLETISVGNDEWLADAMSDITWFTFDEYGKDADKAAFFLLQHSSNLELQKKAVAILEEVAKDGQSDSRNSGLLRDRISIKTDAPQVYGTQGHCVDKGKWQPFELVDPANVERRRSEIGLQPLVDYMDGMSDKYC